MKTNEKAVKLEVEVDGTNPILSFYAGLIVLDREAQLIGDFRIRLACRENGGDFKHAAQLVNLAKIPQRELGNYNTTMQVAMKEAFEGKDTKGLPHGIAGDPKGGSKRKFLERSAGSKLTIQNALAQYGSDLVRDADAVNLRALHAIFGRGRAGDGRHCVTERSLCQVVKS